jgi:thiol-disulfide isomerase/thioredoxin
MSTIFPRLGVKRTLILLGKDNLFMTAVLFLGVFLLPYFSRAQTTYSKEEERMAQYVNNSLAYAWKYDSLQRIQPALDSCVRFLKHYPNSFVKPNVFAYMLKMTALITRDAKRIFPLVDSVLAYDSTSVTKMSIGETLIEQEIDQNRGAEFIRQAFPCLTYSHHRYLSHLLLSTVDLSNGNSSSALRHIKAAIATDSTRLDAWYAYLGYCQIYENPTDQAMVSSKINEIRNKAYRDYVKEVGENRYIGKSVYDLHPPDMNGKTVSFRDFAGKVVAIQNFNFWCSVPKKEFPTVKKLIKELPQVKFIFMNGGETPEELRQRYFTKPSSSFLKNQTIVFEDSSTDQLYRGSYPMGEILLIDKQGVVRYALPGMSKNFEAMLKERLQGLIHEK